MAIVSEEEIILLLGERKHLPRNWRSRLRPKPKANLDHRELEFELTGERGSKFVLWIRESNTDSDDYTVGLRWIDPTGEHRRLRRYNGPAHKHTNHYEKRRGLPNADFSGKHHIHIATVRYQQEPGQAIDGYAEITGEFNSLKTAIQLMLKDNGFVIPRKRPDCPGQKTMFEDE